MSVISRLKLTSSPIPAGSEPFGTKLEIGLLKKVGSRFRMKKESFVESEFSSSHLGKEMIPDLKQIYISSRGNLPENAIVEKLAVLDKGNNGINV